MSDLLTAISEWAKNKTPEQIERVIHPQWARKLFGRRIYLAIDSQGNCAIRELGFLQRIARTLFACFKDTHKKLLLNRLHRIPKDKIQDKTTLKIVAWLETRLKSHLFQTEAKQIEVKEADPRKNRRYPPRSIVDTIIQVKGQIVARHGRGLKHDLFQDQEILHVHHVVRKELLDGNKPDQQVLNDLAKWGMEWHPVYAEFTAHQKAIIQQQAIRGCTAAVTAMLIMDHGKKCNVNELKGRNIGQTGTMEWDIKRAGLTPITSHCSSVEDLKRLLDADGSAIISIGGEIGGHVILVDAIEGSTARIRDPHHGWEITITLEALRARFSNGNSVLQVKS